MAHVESESLVDNEAILGVKKLLDAFVKEEEEHAQRKKSVAMTMKKDGDGVSKTHPGCLLTVVAGHEERKGRVRLRGRREESQSDEVRAKGTHAVTRRK